MELAGLKTSGIEYESCLLAGLSEDILVENVNMHVSLAI